VTRIILIGIVILLLARAFWRLMDGIIEALGGTPKTAGGRARGRGAPDSGGKAVKLVRDPVCGTHIAPSASLSLAAHGTTVYFCSEACRDRFRKTA
jgi:YHS domain-containing protein